MIKNLFSRPKTARAPRWGAWQCAGYSSLALVGLIAFNLAGCGGGGSGPGPIPTPTVTIDLRDVGGDFLTGTVHLKGVSTAYDMTLTASTGRTVFEGVKKGTYLVTVTYDTGTPTSQTDDLVVGSDRFQTFVAVQGVTGVPGAGIKVSGTVLSGTPGCSISSLGLAAKVLLRVRKLDPQQGNPIVASFVKPFQNSNAGKYTILNIPGPGTYIVEARQAPSTASEPTSALCDDSKAFFISSTDTAIANIDLCVNSSNCNVNPTPPAPGGTATPTVGGPPPGG